LSALKARLRACTLNWDLAIYTLNSKEAAIHSAEADLLFIKIGREWYYLKYYYYYCIVSCRITEQSNLVLPDASSDFLCIKNSVNQLYFALDGYLGDGCTMRLSWSVVCPLLGTKWTDW